MVKLSLDRTVRLAEGVVFRELEGETVILNLETGTYFGLDSIGTRIWQLCQEHGLLRTVHQSMQAEYDVTAEVLEADVIELVDELRAKGLVTLS
jgi:Coenzyme PQQ synthesis protein D (PqqD)